jgi:RNA polymerase sigma factor (sigma-70 family)
LALNGDQDAFRILVNEYENLVYCICLNAVHDPHEAENLTQDTFLQVYKSLSRYEFRGFKTWISRIALHKALDFKRRAAGKTKKEEIGWTEMDELPAKEMSIPDLLVKEEEKELLEACLHRMPEHYETVLRKCYQENKSHKQIAMEENISVRTVETRLYRGKKILRDCFEEMNKT